MPLEAVDNAEGTEKRTVQNGRSYRSLLAVLHHLLLFNLLCWSKNCSTKEQWFADNYETGFDGTYTFLESTVCTYSPVTDRAKLTSLLIDS